jgi:glycyl-tRNA synthetase beta chain
LVEQSDYLLEIGTEELPAGFLETAALELRDRTHEALEKNLLAHGDIEVLETPRRLALMIRNLAMVQDTAEETVKGPPASVALDADGNPTQAALGFARKMGIEFSELTREAIEGTEYLVFYKKSSGKPVETVLPEILPDVVLGLSGSHFMAWDESDIKFSRPIRWLVSLLNDRPLPLKIGLVQSGKESRGHRFLAKTSQVTIPSVKAYAEVLDKEGHVVVNQQERRRRIWEGLQEKAKTYKGIVPQNESLLDTVTMLVESPALIVGNFSPSFLSLPRDVITTVMASHQKYFPIEDQGHQLLPHFITISNNTLPEAEESIRQGNEKVLRARLEDASFFFQEDCKHPLSNYVEQLRGITFQKGLGSLYDKTERLKTLVAIIAKQMGLSEVSDAVRAAELCKADLATNMVRELTELQGVVGMHYARLSNEKSEVAEAIREHYQPRFMGDAVAESPLGITLSLADKLDTMVAVFAQKDARYPTGSKDPMGLRRMALGILQTILENKVSLNLEEALHAAYDNLGALAVENQEDTLSRTTQFLLQRFKGYLLDQNFSYDTIDAVLEAGISPFANLTQTIDRLTLLKNLQRDEAAFKLIYEPANRVARILGKAYLPEVESNQINSALFEDDSEKALFAGIMERDPSKVDDAQRLIIFSAWSPLVEAFFNQVMVNAEKADVKENRYRLLSFLNRYYRSFADFTKLVV